MEHPEELSKVAGLQKKVDEVKNVMVDNIEQVHCPSHFNLTQRHFTSYRAQVEETPAPASQW